MKLIPHPAVQIVIWMLLALLAQGMPPRALLLLCATLLGIAMKLSAPLLLSLLRRTRWILLTLLLIYAYTTPGAALWGQLGVVSPTREGVVDGALQLGRLLSVLSALAILLALLPQAQLISGLYTLGYPLRWLGLSRERIAVRLALTLQYAEAAMRDTAADWRSTIREALEASDAGTTHIELGLQSFRIIDFLLLMGIGAVLIGVWR